MTVPVIRNEIEAMDVICNIQAMQHYINGDMIAYEYFNKYNLEELRELQYALIPHYNDSVKKKAIVNNPTKSS